MIPARRDLRHAVPMRTASLLIAFAACAASPAVVAAATCTPPQKAALEALYNDYRAAARLGQLEEVKALTTPALAAQIDQFVKRKTVEPATIARSMSISTPSLELAKSRRCDVQGNRARFVLDYVLEKQVGAAAPSNTLNSTVVLFERIGSTWKVGNKALTDGDRGETADELIARIPQLQLK